MKYVIAINMTPARLAGDVNAYISEGYEPVGGVVVSIDRNSGPETWAQALVKRDAIKPVHIDWICGCGHATKAEHEAAERLIP